MDSETFKTLKAIVINIKDEISKFEKIITNLEKKLSDGSASDVKTPVAKADKTDKKKAEKESKTDKTDKKIEKESKTDKTDKKISAGECQYVFGKGATQGKICGKKHHPESDSFCTMHYKKGKDKKTPEVQGEFTVETKELDIIPWNDHFLVEKHNFVTDKQSIFGVLDIDTNVLRALTDEEILFVKETLGLEYTPQVDEGTEGGSADVETPVESQTEVAPVEVQADVTVDLAQEKADQERVEQERVEQERAEQERLEKVRLEQERLEAERAEQERVEKERLEAERAEQERLETERIEKERLEAERVEQERIEKERLEQERLELEKKSKLESGASPPVTAPVPSAIPKATLVVKPTLPVATKPLVPAVPKPLAPTLKPLVPSAGIKPLVPTASKPLAPALKPSVPTATPAAVPVAKAPLLTKPKVADIPI